jgi:hypothetical protein
MVFKFARSNLQKCVIKLLSGGDSNNWSFCQLKLYIVSSTYTNLLSNHVLLYVRKRGKQDMFVQQKS